MSAWLRRIFIYMILFSTNQIYLLVLLLPLAALSLEIEETAPSFNAIELEKLEPQTALFITRKKLELSLGKKMLFKSNYQERATQEVIRKASVWLYLSSNNRPLRDKEIEILQQSGIKGVLYPYNENLDKNSRAPLSLGNLSLTPDETAIDLELAFQAVSSYPGLFQLVEVEEKDYALLPNHSTSTPLTSTQVISLQKAGYFPSYQNAPLAITAPILGVDGKNRRWLYPYDQESSFPLFNPYDPSYGVLEILSGKALGIIEQGASILSLHLPFPIEGSGLTILPIQIRKMGGYSYEEVKLTLQELALCTKRGVDLISHPLFSTALFHALLREDCTLLTLLYEKLLSLGLTTRGWVHKSLSSVDYDLQELLSWEEPISYQSKSLHPWDLRHQISKEDLKKLEGAKGIIKEGGVFLGTPLSFCRAAVGDTPKLQFDAHRLLTFFLAMQPGVIALTSSDLYGEKEGGYAYCNLYDQNENPLSFLSQLKLWLKIRNVYHIDEGQLVRIIPTKPPGLFAMLHRLSPTDMLQLTLVNFSKKEIDAKITIAEIQELHGIDLLTRRAIAKEPKSSFVEVTLPPLGFASLGFLPIGSIANLLN